MLHAPVSETKTKTEAGRRGVPAEPVRELHPYFTGLTGNDPVAQRRQPLAPLQATYGNQAVLRMLHGSAATQGGMLQRKCACGGTPGPTGECAACRAKRLQRQAALQPKLTVDAANNPYEQAANRFADQVSATPAKPQVSLASLYIQRDTGQTDSAPVGAGHGLSSPGRPFDPALQGQFDDGDPPLAADAPGKGATACPAFVSLTASVKAARVSDSCGACRLELGCCSTPRGTCGSTKESGAVIKGAIDVPEGCTGELGFMQNLLSTDRKRTLTDKSEECQQTTSARLDGGIPWKGCKLAVTKAGRHTVETDDCPNIGLGDNMSAASAKDAFKTFLIWKKTGASGWQVIGKVNWGWSGSTVSKQGKDCQSNWTAPGGSPSSGAGEASTEKPVTSPKAQDLRWGPCKKG